MNMFAVVQPTEIQSNLFGVWIHLSIQGCNAWIFYSRPKEIGGIWISSKQLQPRKSLYSWNLLMLFSGTISDWLTCEHRLTFTEYYLFSALKIRNRFWSCTMGKWNCLHQSYSLLLLAGCSILIKFNFSDKKVFSRNLFYSLLRAQLERFTMKRFQNCDLYW